MALGKIKADTLEHSTAGSLDTQFVVNGSAKAWIHFNGTGTVAIKDSLNIASLSDAGTGLYNCAISSDFGGLCSSDPLYPLFEPSPRCRDRADRCFRCIRCTLSGLSAPG